MDVGSVDRQLLCETKSCAVWRKEEENKRIYENITDKSQVSWKI